MESPARELPRHDDLFWPVVRALRELDGSADNDQLVEKVSELLELPDELTAIPRKSGPQSKIGYRIAWVKSWLKWGGMLDNPRRGVWMLTELGRGATEEDVNEVCNRRRAETSIRRKTGSPKIKLVSESAEDAPASEELKDYADDDWQNALLDAVRAMQASAAAATAALTCLVSCQSIACAGLASGTSKPTSAAP
jgi:restriction system protein